jgi:hypothetical protein
MSGTKKTDAPGQNAQTTSGQQESRDTGSAGDTEAGSARAPIPAGDSKGRQAYDRGGKASRDFKRAGQTHADVQDRTG